MPKFLPRLSIARRQGPPILASQEPSSQIPVNAYALTEVVPNITFTGGTHSLTATHALTTVAANVTFTGGTHALKAGHSLTTVKANITFTGGTHGLAAQHSLTEVKANVAFAGGTHSLIATHALTSVAANITFTGGTHFLQWVMGGGFGLGYTLTTVKSDVRFTGGTHLLQWSGEAPPTEQGGAGGRRAVRPQETLRHYRLWQHPADLRLVGGVHELIYDNSGTLDDEESLLLLVE